VPNTLRCFVLDRSLKAPSADADRLSRDRKALGVESVEQGPRPAPRRADERVIAELEVVEEQGPLVVERRRLHLHPRGADRFRRQLDDKQPEAAVVGRLGNN
jgi:hypothetical protein